MSLCRMPRYNKCSDQTRASKYQGAHWMLRHCLSEEQHTRFEPYPHQLRGCRQPGSGTRKGRSVFPSCDGQVICYFQLPDDAEPTHPSRETRLSAPQAIVIAMKQCKLCIPASQCGICCRRLAASRSSRVPGKLCPGRCHSTHSAVL